MAKDEFKIIDRGFELVCLCAFRYAVNRHLTQAMVRGRGDGDTIENVILANLKHINSNYKCQMMRNILEEFEFYDRLDCEEEFGTKIYPTGDGDYDRVYYSPHYLDNMFETLKQDYRDTHDGAEWRKGVQL